MPKASTRSPAERARAAERAAKAADTRKARVYYSAKVVRPLLERLAAGERWTHIAGTEGMPGYHALYVWRDKYPDFAEALARAMQAGADARADAVLDVAEAATAETASVDRMHIGALKWRVDRDDKRWPRKDEPDRGEGRVLVVRVRRFETYVAEDGTQQVREIMPPRGKRAR